MADGFVKMKDKYEWHSIKTVSGFAELKRVTVQHFEVDIAGNCQK